MLMKETCMNDVTALVARISAEFPGVRQEVDAADQPGNTSWIDLKLGASALTVVISPSRGLGLYTSGDSVFGEHPDEVVPDADALLKRLHELLTLSA